LHGNRDFLLGPDYLKKTGMTLLPDPCAIKIAGQDYVLSHGDALCTADIGYQVFRKWTRKRWVQKLFLQFPLQWRRSIANQLRRNSALKYQKASRYAPANRSMKMDVTTRACATLIEGHGSDRLIHGHTHMPGHHHEQLGDTRWQRWVLSDWDLDHPESVLPKASALLIDEQGVRYLDLVK
jgi:UDP-2,3-diacylglucosamine hydrolase